MNTRLRSIGARASLAEDRFIRIEIGSPRSAVFNSSHHSRLDLRDQVRDIQCALDLRNQMLCFLLALRVLQIVHRSAVRDGTDYTGKLQRSETDSISETRHHAYAGLGRLTRQISRFFPSYTETC